MADDTGVDRTAKQTLTDEPTLQEDEFNFFSSIKLDIPYSEDDTVSGPVNEEASSHDAANVEQGGEDPEDELICEVLRSFLIVFGLFGVCLGLGGLYVFLIELCGGAGVVQQRTEDLSASWNNTEKLK